jgi:hypothetical protein
MKKFAWMVGFVSLLALGCNNPSTETQKKMDEANQAATEAARANKEAAEKAAAAVTEAGKEAAADVAKAVQGAIEGAKDATATPPPAKPE